jgi:hypothetical protein
MFIQLIIIGILSQFSAAAIVLVIIGVAYRLGAKWTAS